jgi:hypothetical protein
MGKPHILAQAVETGILPFKKQIPLKCKKGSMRKEDLPIITIFDPC